MNLSSINTKKLLTDIDEAWAKGGVASAMDISLSELFDKLGKSGGNNIAAKCYDLVASKNEAEQKQLYKMLQEMDKYKNQ